MPVMPTSVASRPASSLSTGQLFALIVLSVAAGVLIAGLGFWVISSGVLTPKHTLEGTFTLYAGDDRDQVETIGDRCMGAAGYTDLREGATVLVQDGAEVTLGVGSLSAGTPSVLGCEFTFEVPQVGDAPIYTVRVGRRGGPSWRREELDANGWAIALSIGD